MDVGTRLLHLNMVDKSTSVTGAKAVNLRAVRREQSQMQQSAGWKETLRFDKAAHERDSVEQSKDDVFVEKWSLGILNDKHTEEVPGQYNPQELRSSTILTVPDRHRSPAVLESEQTSWSSASIQEAI